MFTLSVMIMKWISFLLLAGATLVELVPPPTTEEHAHFILKGKYPIKSANNTSHHLKRIAFKNYYIGSGTFTKNRPSTGTWLVVEATPSVTDYAHYYTTLIAYRQTLHMPADIFRRLATHAKVGVFTKQDTLTIFPEYAYLADKPGCHHSCSGSCSTSCTFDGRKYSTLAGTGGQVAAIIDDNVLCNSQDPYNHNSNILVHEFAHTIHRYGLTSGTKAQIKAAYNHAKSAQLWKLSEYAMSNDEEYWAEGTQVFFNCEHLSYSTGGMNRCNTGTYCRDETAARNWLRQHDPMLFNVLQYVYTNNNPNTPGNIGVCILPPHSSG